MSLKKRLVTFIRGWLPKEPNLSSYQQATNSKTWRIPRIGIALIFMGGVVGGLAGALVSSLGIKPTGLGVYVWPMIIGIVMGIVIAAILIRIKQKEEQQRSRRNTGVLKKHLENHILGWLPKKPNFALAHKTSKPRWRKPYWITFMLVVVVALAAITFVGVNTYIRYSNPLMDITASYYEKTVNSTTAGIGDIVEVKVLVGWHGYVLPEFKRDVRIVDPFPESYFTLAGESNVYESRGYGGSYQLKYLLRAIGEEGISTDFPKPRLYLDNVEIPLSGTSPTLNISSK